MMYVEQYAQQRLNELQAERDARWRRIAEHWEQDARTQRASAWPIVRLIKRLFGRRSATDNTRVPDGARVADDARVPDELWPEGSAAGRFAESAPPAREQAELDGEKSDRELVCAR